MEKSLPANNSPSVYPRIIGIRQIRKERIARLWNNLGFLSLTGFIATQGYLIPVMSLPVNWAIWPNLPDIFGAVLILMVLLPSRKEKLSKFDKETLKDLFKIGIFFLLNFVAVTVPFSTTGEGIKFGVYSLIIFSKYLLVYWAAAQIGLSHRRKRILYFASVAAFFWLSITVLADRFSLIEIDYFSNHLPRIAAGKWGITNLDSTASATHGGTTVVLLLLSGLVLGTAQKGSSIWIELIVMMLGGATTFISGSRQGLVRFAAFVFSYSVKKPLKYLLVIAIALFALFLTSYQDSGETIESNPYYLLALERQEVLLADPFSNESLSGRPELWIDVIDTLNEAPYRWLIGYGMGNYVEHKNSAHNMFLQLLQDGGLIELFIVGALWIRIFIRIYQDRHRSWVTFSITIGMLTSIFTSAIFYPNLATGWYLGLYFILLHLGFGGKATDNESDPSPVKLKKFPPLRARHA